MATNSVQNVEVYQQGPETEGCNFALGGGNFCPSFGGYNLGPGMGSCNSWVGIGGCNYGAGMGGCNSAALLDIASDMLVEYVCEQTAPSPYRYTHINLD